MKADGRNTVGSVGSGWIMEQKTRSPATRRLPAVVAVPLGATSAFIVRDRSVLLVDTGNPGDDAAILAAMKQAGIGCDEVSLILVTHGHPENYGSADALRELTGAPVAVHEGDAAAVRPGVDGTRSPVQVVPGLIRLVRERRIVSGPGGVEPDIIIGGIADLGVFGLRGRIVPTPGHTPGSVSVLLAGGTVIVGDLLSALFPGGRPRLPFRMDDPAAARRSLRDLLALGPELIYAAHGGPWRGTEVWRRFGSGRTGRKARE
jgi:glyoxylase-like metal-dependent hydrolase (beta-lactamase superfamily II)